MPARNNSDLTNFTFRVWAPEKEKVTLHIVHPDEQKVQLRKDSFGYFSVTLRNVSSQCRYFFQPGEEKDYPDPASQYQPEGVHGPSQVIDHGNFSWSDQNWKGVPFHDLIIYEIHVGTFTPEGTFEAIIPRLDELTSVGINAIELMPVSQFPGNRNWGYDGVYPFAVQNSYGGPDGLKRLVNECHSRGIAVFLDVVYNHLGPEGNYSAVYAPYFTDRYKVPWGDAINFDDAWCDGVRDYFSENVIFWFEKYHFDGLRVDAIHMIFDSGAEHFWELVQKKVKMAEQKLGRKFYLIAESDLNSPRVVKHTEIGGYGFDAMWLDDFHHALYVILDKKGKSRYQDFGSMEQLAKAYKEGFVHSGEHVKFRRKKHGVSSAGISGDRFIAFNQNHDQIGNRVLGDRLSAIVGFERLKMAAAALLLSPYIPMLFMGEEYGEDNPFFYFVSHSDKALIKAVRQGRKKEFEGYKWHVDPPDPQDTETFESSKISWQKRENGKHKILLEWNRTLISLRRSLTCLKNFDKNCIIAFVGLHGLTLQRKSADQQEILVAFFNFSEQETSFLVPSALTNGYKILDSESEEWNQTKNPKELAPVRIKASDTIDINPCSIVVYINREL